jgi:hypothetical protein
MTQTGGGPRVPPLGPPYDPSIKTMLNKWMPPGSAVETSGTVLHICRTRRSRGTHEAARAGILAHGQIELREREIVIHRTCLYQQEGEK